MQKMLPSQIRVQVEEVLRALQKPIEIVVFKSTAVSGLEKGEVGLQDETLILLREVAELSDKVHIEERSLQTDPEAHELGLSFAPTLLFRERGSQRSNIRFLGMPSGYEFSTLLETLVMLGTGQNGLGERSKTELDSLSNKVHLQSFVTPGCPYCPKAVLAAYKLAFHNSNVIAEGIEANEFPGLSTKFRISSVPDTIISGTRQERVLGGQPDRVFVQAVLKAGGNAVAGGVR